MSTLSNDSPPTDVNERRRLQNRLAQKNYRTRQKIRMRLAEAVLHEMPNIHAAIAAVGSKRKDSLTGAPNNVPESVQALANFALMSGGSGDSTALPATNHHATIDGTSGEDPTGQLRGETDFQVNPDLEYSVEQTLNTNCIDPALMNYEWVGLECNSPPNAHLASPPLPAPRGSELGASIESEKVYSDQSTSDRSFRWQKPKSPQVGALGMRIGTSTPTLQTSSLETISIRPSATSLSSSQNASTSTSIIPVSSDSDEPLEDLAARTEKQGESHKSPLLTAIALGNLEIARILLSSGAKLDVPDRGGKTALHRAVESGDARLVAALLELGADVLTKDLTGRGLLHTAVDKNKLEMVRLILECCRTHSSGKLVSNPAEEDGRSSDGRGEGGSLLKRCIDAQDGRKMTAVHDCVLLGRAEILKLLLDYGADVNIGCN